MLFEIKVLEVSEVRTPFALKNSFPNPFTSTTTIRFDLPSSGQARLVVYNLLGQEVAVLLDENLGAASYEVTFDASGLPSGVYICQLEAGRSKAAISMLLTK